MTAILESSFSSEIKEVSCSAGRANKEADGEPAAEQAACGTTTDGKAFVTLKFNPGLTGDHTDRRAKSKKVTGGQPPAELPSPGGGRGGKPAGVTKVLAGSKLANGGLRLDDLSIADDLLIDGDMLEIGGLLQGGKINVGALVGHCVLLFPVNFYRIVPIFWTYVLSGCTER